MAAQTRALVKPEVLAWARASAGFAVAEAANKLGIDPDRLAGWESGEDAPSIPQLRKLADLYKRPLAVLYLQRVPAEFQVIRDLRRLPGTGFRCLPPELMLEVRRAQQRRELALELLDDLGDETPAFLLAAAQDEDPEMVGARIRVALGVSSEDQSRWSDTDGRAAFNAWRSRIENMGVLVFQATHFTSEQASGFALSEDRLPVIVINRKDTPTRRSFSLLHELAHLMLRVSGVSDLDADELRPPEDLAIEVFCNRVAAAALVPRSGLFGDARVAAHEAFATDWTDGELNELARDFGVSREALLRRLLTFGRTTDAFYRQKRRQYLEEFQVQRQRQREQRSENRMARNMPRETISEFGRPLVRIILGNYYQDRLTLSEVSGYLGIKTKHIAKLEQIAGVR